MTRIQVSGEAIMALGTAMTQVSDDLLWSAAQARAHTSALGRGDSAAALGQVLGDFEHQRQLLGQALGELADQTRLAGSLYAEVELDIQTSIGGDSW